MYIEIQVHTYVVYMYMYSVDLSIDYIKPIHKVHTEATGGLGRSNCLSMAGYWPLGRSLQVNNKMKGAAVIFIKHLY